MLRTREHLIIHREMEKVTLLQHSRYFRKTRPPTITEKVTFAFSVSLTALGSSGVAWLTGSNEGRRSCGRSVQLRVI